MLSMFKTDFGGSSFLTTNLVELFSFVRVIKEQIGHKLIKCVELLCFQMFIPKVVVMYMLGMLAFAFYIAKFPERFFPGKS